MHTSSRLTTSRTALIGTLACGVAAAGAPSASASVAPAAVATPLTTGQVLFVFHPQAGGSQIAVANTDGSQMRTITPTGPGIAPGDALARPRISPDGKHLSFIDKNLLYVANPDGTNAVQVSPTLPPGTLLAFGNYEWSADSAYLYVTESTPVPPPPGIPSPPPQTTTQLAEIHPDGSGLKGFGVGGPHSIGFSVAAQTGEIGYVSGQAYSIFNPGTGQTRTVPYHASSGLVSLSPDAKYLAYVAAGPYSAESAVWVQPADGSAAWVALHYIYSGGNLPAWSSDESQLANDGATNSNTSAGRDVNAGSSSGNGPTSEPPIPAVQGTQNWTADSPSWVPLPAGTPLKAPTNGIVPPPHGGARPVATRMGGGDRIDTAIVVAEAAYGPASGKHAQVAVLSRSDGYADALAGNALAAQKGGPLLLTGSAGLDPRVRTELSNRLTPGSTVYVLGGTGALSPQVEADIKALNLVPKRLAGSNRYDTSVAIAGEITQHPHTVLVATGNDYPDALAAGAAAATDPAGGVVVLSNGGTVTGQVPAYLAGVDPATTRVFGVGGQGVIALNTTALTGHFTPLSGSDRYATDLAVASDPTLYPATPVLGLATGLNWPDALAGGAFTGTLHAPLLLLGQNTVDPRELQWLQGHGSAISTMNVFGGPSVVSTTVLNQAGNAAWGTGTWDYHPQP